MSNSSAIGTLTKQRRRSRATCILIQRIGGAGWQRGVQLRHDHCAGQQRRDYRRARLLHLRSCARRRWRFNTGTIKTLVNTGTLTGGSARLKSDSGAQAFSTAARLPRSSTAAKSEAATGLRYARRRGDELYERPLTTSPADDHGGSGNLRVLAMAPGGVIGNDGTYQQREDSGGSETLLGGTVARRRWGVNRNDGMLTIAGRSRAASQPPGRQGDSGDAISARAEHGIGTMPTGIDMAASNDSRVKSRS